MERFGDDEDSALVAETDSYRIYQVRWPVLEGVFGEGLLLEPVRRAVGFVIALPDADQQPEQLAFAHRLAATGFEVVVPVLSIARPAGRAIPTSTRRIRRIANGFIARLFTWAGT